MNATKRLPHTLLKTFSPSRSNCRNLHTTSTCLAKYSRPSKPVRQRVPRPGNPSLDAETSLPPSIMLAAAQRSGVIELAPEAVVDFLEDFIESERKRLGEWERDVCEKHKITPQTLTLLAGILRRSPTPSQHLLATRLMLSASHLGSKEATYELILTYLSNAPTTPHSPFTKPTNPTSPTIPQSHPSTKPPIRPLHPTPQKALAKLVKESDPSALALHGKLLKHQGKHVEALDFLTRATSGVVDHADTGFEGAGDALVEKGILLLKLKPEEKELAKEAFKKAALELDEPMAYYYLARWEARGSVEENVYLIKAASSGVLEAIIRLGQLELGKIIGSPLPLTNAADSGAGKAPLPKTIEGYGMAGEWIRLAASRGDQASMLHLGCMLKSVGQKEQWRELKERVGDTKGWTTKTVEAREQWTLRGVEFLGE